LAYAHEAQDALGQPLGIVHRDVSPPNVLITRHGEVKVVDFGLAKANSQLESSEPGIIKGKFSYLSPEAANGEDVDHRTDIFATGIMLWEMITGQRLFMGDTDLGTVRLVQAARVPPLSQYVKEVPAVLEQIISHSLARDPKTRYQSAREFGRDLNRVLFQMGRPVSSFDIGGLVTDVKEEQRRQRGARPKQQTLIGNLIQDAMMSFTSLQEDEESDAALDPGPEEQSGVGAIPLSFGTFEGSHAATRLPAAEPSQVNLAPPGGYEAGNLAALEDQGFDAPRGQSQPPRGPQSGGTRPPPKRGVQGSARPPARSLRPAGYPGHAPHLVPAPATASLPLRFWVLTATLVTAGMVLAAYLAGVFS
jgi:serine/threonine protein kinase